jgi:hypothetical protein
MTDLVTRMAPMSDGEGPKKRVEAERELAKEEPSAPRR